MANKYDKVAARLGPRYFMALALVQFDEANRVRAWLGKPAINEDDFLDAIKNKAGTIPPLECEQMPPDM
jgi:hypothetical protein